MPSKNAGEITIEVPLTIECEYCGLSLAVNLVYRNARRVLCVKRCETCREMDKDVWARRMERQD